MAKYRPSIVQMYCNDRLPKNGRRPYFGHFKKASGILIRADEIRTEKVCKFKNINVTPIKCKLMK